MRQTSPWIAAGLALVAATGLGRPVLAQQAATDGPYHVLKTAKVGGDGGFDYVYADADGRRLYVPRGGAAPRVSVYDLDALTLVGEIPNTGGHGVASDTKYHTAFGTSNPIAMWDSKTLTLVKSIPSTGGPDGILGDAYNHRVYVLSHSAPNVTVLDAKDGTVLGTIDLGAAPEQAVTDGKGHLYIDLEDQGAVGVVDAKTMKMTGTYSLNGKGAGDAGLAFDVKNHVLFVACRDPQRMVILDSNTGKYLTDLPIGQGCDGAVFNPKTGECFSSQRDGTLTVIKENSPTDFVVEQTVTTMPGAKTLTLDSKTGDIYLIAGQYGPAPAPVAGERPRRGQMLPGSFSIIQVGK